MAVLWSEDFETGPDGAALTDANTTFEVLGDATFSSEQVKSGALSAYRQGGPSGSGSCDMSTVEPAPFFQRHATATFNAWHYITAGQELPNQPSAELLILSTQNPTAQFINLEYAPSGATVPGFRLSASAQSDVLMGDVPGEAWYRMQLKINPTQFVGRVFNAEGSLVTEGALDNTFAPSGRAVAQLFVTLYHGHVDGVTVEASPSVAPPCRRYPRTDALSNSARRYPPPKSRQYGNRATGYL